MSRLLVTEISWWYYDTIRDLQVGARSCTEGGLWYLYVTLSERHVDYDCYFQLAVEIVNLLAWWHCWQEKWKHVHDKEVEACPWFASVLLHFGSNAISWCGAFVASGHKKNCTIPNKYPLSSALNAWFTFLAGAELSWVTAGRIRLRLLDKTTSNIFE